MKCFNFPINKQPIKPPKGRAIKGSITIPAIGLSDKIIIATKGPKIAAKKLGPSSPSELILISFSLISLPFFVRALAIIIVTIIPKIAGIIPAAITDVKGRLKASEAAIAFGLGDIMFPDFPPPIIAIKTAVLDKFVFLAIAIAIGATVITATSIKTPTIVKIIAEITMAITALDSPNLLTIVSAIFFAAPVSINTPANTPAVIILKIAGIIP